MIAPRSRAEPALPTTSRGRSSRSTTDGAIIDVRRAPGRAPPRRSVSPSMLFRCTPVPGTTTPELEPSDDESDAAPPRAPTTELCVVPERTPPARPPREGEGPH